MDGSQPTPAPGWYDDPRAPGCHRYWDGTGWTGSVRAATDLPPGTGSATSPSPAWTPPTARTVMAEHGPAVTDTPVARRRVWPIVTLTAASLLLVGGGALATVLILDDGDNDAALAALDDADEPSTTDDGVSDSTEQESSTDPNGTAPDPDPGTDAGTDAVEAEPAPDDDGAVEDPSVSDDIASDTTAQGDTDDMSDPIEPGPSPVEIQERMLDALDRYLNALDRLDPWEAHAQLASSLQEQPGWSLEEFVEFWDGLLARARLLDIREVDVAAQEVEVLVVYELQDGSNSQELLRVGFDAAEPRAPIISYRVLRADHQG